MRSIERIDIPLTIGDSGPAGGLHSAGALQRQLVKIPFPPILGYPALIHQPQQIPICADIVESDLVYASMRDVRRHGCHRALASSFQELCLAGRVELQNGRAELEALRPFGPAAACVLSADREHGRALRWLPGSIERPDFHGGGFKQALYFSFQVLGGKLSADLNHCRIINGGIGLWGRATYFSREVENNCGRLPRAAPDARSGLGPRISSRRHRLHWM